MRTLTIPLSAASPRARLVIAEQAAGVALWLSEPDIHSVRDRPVRTGGVARHHLAELGEFLHERPEPDYEPGPGQDRATRLARFAASSPRPYFSNLDLRLNRGRTDVRAGQPQGLLCNLAPAGSPCCSRPSTSPSFGPVKTRQPIPPGPRRISGTSAASATS